jgi:hypothetical protein
VDTELEKLDAIRQRMRVSYAEAREALAEANGDVIQAIINLENSKGDLLSAAIELVDDVQKLLDAKNISKIRLRFGGKTIAEHTVSLAAAAAVLVALGAAIISKTSVEIEQEKEETEES